jgi:transcriptional regulator with XRE-family HTH domain
MQTPRYCGRRVKLARNMLGLSRRDLEEKFHISSHTLQSWENGRNPLTLKGAKKLSNAFAKLGLLCSDKWLLTGQGNFPVLVMNGDKTLKELTEDLRILREVESFEAINPSPIVVAIADDGMTPVYNLADYVGGNKRYGDEISCIVGTYCIVETIEGDTFVRKLLHGKKESIYNLACINNYSQQQPLIVNVKLLYAAQVVWHRAREIFTKVK